MNGGLYHRIRFSVFDPVVYLVVPAEDGQAQSFLILRDIEMDRARQRARVDHVHCPADFEPEGGLSGGDRDPETLERLKALGYL